MKNRPGLAHLKKLYWLNLFTRLWFLRDVRDVLHLEAILWKHFLSQRRVDDLKKRSDDVTKWKKFISFTTLHAWENVSLKT